MKYMYFGTRERMSWVPCPAIEVDMSKVGWSASGQFLNGGSYVRRSATASKTYNFSWNTMSQRELRKIMDYFDGLYGQGPFYFIDPFAVDNILPSFWASPRLQAEDAPTFVRDKRPTLMDTTPTGNAYPTKMARYTLAETDVFASIWLPIPDGHTLHFGAHGSATGSAAVTVTPDGGTTSTVPFLAMGSSTLTNRTYSGVSGVTISGQTTSATPGTITLGGLIAAIRPTGQPAPTGEFVSGQGHSGCQFADRPSEEGYSAALDLKGAAVTLIETGAWE